MGLSLFPWLGFVVSTGLFVVELRRQYLFFPCFWLVLAGHLFVLRTGPGIALLNLTFFAGLKMVLAEGPSLVAHYHHYLLAFSFFLWTLKA